MICLLLSLPMAFYIVTARKRSLGQGNIFRSVCQEFCPRGGRGECLTRYTPLGPGRYPPGPFRYTPQGPGRYTPWDQAGTPPGTRQVHPPGTRQVHPLGPGRYTPQDQAGTPPGTRQVHPPGTRQVRPPGTRQVHPPQIRSTRGRYASYWNAILLSHVLPKILILIVIDVIFTLQR